MEPDRAGSTIQNERQKAVPHAWAESAKLCWMRGCADDRRAPQNQDERVKLLESTDGENEAYRQSAGELDLLARTRRKGLNEMGETGECISRWSRPWRSGTDYGKRVRAGECDVM